MCGWLRGFMCGWLCYGGGGERGFQAVPGGAMLRAGL